MRRFQMDPGTARRARCSIRIAGDGAEVGSGGLIRFLGALFPVSQRAEWDLKPRGEFLLRQAERAADDFQARHLPHARQPFRRQGLSIGIGERGGVGLVVG
jgi:hypothetical protein